MQFCFNKFTNSSTLLITMLADEKWFGLGRCGVKKGGCETIIFRACCKDIMP